MSLLFVMPLLMLISSAFLSFDLLHMCFHRLSGILVALFPHAGEALHSLRKLQMAQEKGLVSQFGHKHLHNHSAQNHRTRHQ